MHLTALRKQVGFSTTSLGSNPQSSVNSLSDYLSFNNLQTSSQPLGASRHKKIFSLVIEFLLAASAFVEHFLFWEDIVENVANHAYLI
jgi:hypothetical protein